MLKICNKIITKKEERIKLYNELNFIVELKTKDIKVIEKQREDVAKINKKIAIADKEMLVLRNELNEEMFGVK